LNAPTAYSAGTNGIASAAAFMRSRMKRCMSVSAIA
jgi:hypothetical protein